MATNQRQPIYLFRLEIDGITRAYFQKISGLKATLEVDEYDEGGSMITQKDAGKPTYPNIVLTGAMTEDLQMYNWFQEVLDAVDGIGEDPINYKKNFDVVSLNRKKQEIMRHRVIASFPVDHDLGDYDASQKSGYRLETIELAQERNYIVQ